MSENTAFLFRDRDIHRSGSAHGRHALAAAAWGLSHLLVTYVEEDVGVRGNVFEVLAVDLAERRVWIDGDDPACVVRNNLGMRRRYLELASRAWPGWSLRWLERGAGDLRERGFADSHLESEEARAVLTERAHLDEHVLRDAGGGPCALITVLGPNGALDYAIDAASENAIEQALALGPDLPSALVNRAPCAPLREAQVEAGAVVDPEARRIEYWFSAPIAERIDDLCRWLRGWTLARQLEGYPRQLRAAGRDPRPYEITVDECRVSLEAALQLDRSVGPLSAEEKRLRFDEWARG